MIDLKNYSTMKLNLLETSDILHYLVEHSREKKADILINCSNHDMLVEILDGEECAHVIGQIGFDLVRMSTNNREVHSINFSIDSHLVENKILKKLEKINLDKWYILKAQGYIKLNKKKIKNTVSMSCLFDSWSESYDSELTEELINAYQSIGDIFKKIKINKVKVLDLGCGTGVGYKYIFPSNDNIELVGIDLSKGMLDKLEKNHPTLTKRLVCTSYFNIDLSETFDCILSMFSFHHFTYHEKLELYQKVYSLLRYNGVFIECDYVVNNAMFHEINVIYKRNFSQMSDILHYDLPITCEHQVRAYKNAGFSTVDICKTWSNAEDDTILFSMTKMI